MYAYIVAIIRFNEIIFKSMSSIYICIDIYAASSIFFFITSGTIEFVAIKIYVTHCVVKDGSNVDTCNHERN